MPGEESPLSTNEAGLEAASPPPPASLKHQVVAPVWHTVVFLLVVLVFSVLAAKSQGRMVAQHGRAITYVLTMVWEWLLVLYIVWGARRKGLRIRDLIGGRWNNPEAALIDVALAIGFWAVAAVVLAAASFALGLTHPVQIEQAKKQIGALLPRTPLETGLWLALSATAGFCEEIMFRGYLQSQFTALTRSTGAALLLQAMVFGIAHAYQGGRRILLIALYGFLFGLLAAWRRSLRPGMLGHAFQDSFSGIMFRLIRSP